MTPPPLDVLILGDLNPDLVLTGDVVPRFGQAEQLLDGADLLLGGSGAITAHGLARLGARVALVAQVGPDAFGDLVLDILRAAGVDVTPVTRSASAGTGLSVILSDGDSRSTLTYLGAIDAAPPPWSRPSDLPPARHLHVSSYYLQPQVAAALPTLLPLARAGGMTVSLDTNLDPTGAFAGLPEVLGLVDYLLPNATEVRGMAAALDPTAPGAHGDLVTAAATVAAHGPTVVVKDGAAGALLVRRDGTVRRDPGRPVRAVDTTGAGDTFDAGFLAALARGLGEAEALAWGTAAGRLATRALGGTTAQPTLAELLDDLAARL